MSWLAYRLAYFSGQDAMAKKRWPQAEQDFNHALDTTPFQPDSSLSLAQVEWELGKKVEARHRIQTLLEKEPGISSAYFLLGQFSYKENQIANARTFFEKSVELDSQNTESWYWLGKCCLQLGNELEALQAYRKVVQQDPFVTPTLFAELKEKIQQNAKFRP